MVLQILTIWLLFTVVLCFISLKWGLSLFLIYFILIPGFNLNIPELGSGQNFILVLIFIAFVYQIARKKYKIDFRLLSPFIILTISKLVVIPFQDMPIVDNLNYCRKFIFDTLLLPFFLLNVINNDKTSLLLFRRTIVVCIIVVVGYGLFLTTTGGQNPYAIYMAYILDFGQDYEYYYSAEGSGRMFGRISSVFYHPMTFGLFLGCAIIYLYYLLNFEKKMIWIIVLLCSIIIALLCGVRSVLGGLVISMFFYMLLLQNFRLIIYFSLACLALLYIISLLPNEIYVYLMSIFDTKSYDVKGSSIELRLYQMQGAIDIMKQNPLFGLGNNWTSYYQSIHGDHPVCLAFESLIFVVLCNSGIVGVIMWCYMIFYFFSINKKNNISYANIVNMLMVFYISYSTITGEYNYMKYVVLFYVLMYGESYRRLLAVKKNNYIYVSY